MLISFQKFYNFLTFILGAPISYYSSERKRGKGISLDSPKNGCKIGISIPGAFKLNHLQPFMLILFKKFYIFLIFILEAPISYYSSERKRGKGYLWIHPKTDAKEEYEYLVHSN